MTDITATPPNGDARTRTTQKSPYKHFERAMAALKLGAPALSERLGYSDHAWKDWQNQSAMPKVAAQLCDLWVSNDGAVREVVIVIRAMTPEQRAAVMSIVVALGLDHLEV